jgi:hypothetical protein
LFVEGGGRGSLHFVGFDPAAKLLAVWKGGEDWAELTAGALDRRVAWDASGRAVVWLSGAGAQKVQLKFALVSRGSSVRSFNVPAGVDAVVPSPAMFRYLLIASRTRRMWLMNLDRNYIEPVVENFCESGGGRDEVFWNDYGTEIVCPAKGRFQVWREHDPSAVWIKTIVCRHGGGNLPLYPSPLWESNAGARPGLAEMAKLLDDRIGSDGKRYEITAAADGEEAFAYLAKDSNGVFHLAVYDLALNRGRIVEGLQFRADRVQMTALPGRNAVALGVGIRQPLGLRWFR